jgi:hypothetical protein
MNTKIKVQHYVPRLYLNSFVIKSKKRSIYCYEKRKSRCFEVSTKNIASESYFYDVPNEEEQKIEKTLNSIESSFDPVYRKILENEDLESLTSDEERTVALFVMAQELRTKEQRETIADMMRQAKQRLYKETLSEEFKERYDIDKWDTEEQIKSLHLSMFRQIPLYAEITHQMKWILLVNHTPMPFWTSDHPINRFNPVNAEPYGNLGLLCRGIEIHFPLSPKLALSFCDPTAYALLPSRYQIEDIQNVEFENWLQVAHSTRYIFSKTNDFALADKILRENPSLRQIDRKRIQMN